MTRKNKRCLWIAMVAALGLYAAPLVAARAQMEGTATKDGPKEQAVTAEVMAVDIDAGTIRVKVLDQKINESLHRDEVAAESSDARGERLVLRVDSDTRIEDVDGRLTNIASLHPGERLNIRFQTDVDGKMRATGVDKTES